MKNIRILGFSPFYLDGAKKEQAMLERCYVVYLKRKQPKLIAEEMGFLLLRLFNTRGFDAIMSKKICLVRDPAFFPYGPKLHTNTHC